jgi:predicted RNase H-like nuclease (RuvC/YqgF family)
MPSKSFQMLEEKIERLEMENRTLKGMLDRKDKKIEALKAEIKEFEEAWSYNPN